MHNKKSGGISTKILMLAVVVAGVLIMVFSAVTATSLYKINADEFTSALGQNLAALCSDSDFGLSKTQLRMIECADVKNVKYQTTDDGQKQFYAEVRLINPKINCGSYSGDKPNEYLANVAESLYDNKWSYVPCEIVGLCVDDKPVIDTENLQKLVSCVEESWNNGEGILENKNVVAAINDALCPAPFKDRNYSQSTDYTLSYSRFLDKCSAYFAEDGIKINGENLTQSPSVRKVIAKIFTPYFCSADNLQIASSTENKGMLSLTFNSLNIIQSISEAKNNIIESGISEDQIDNTIISNIVSDISNYASDKTMFNNVEIDFVDFMSEDAEKNWSYYGMLRAVLEYYGGCAEDIANSSTKEEITECKIIDGGSNGQWPIEIKRNEGDGNVIIDIIKIGDNETEKSVMKLFLVDGGSQIVCLGQGKYRLNIAVGANYFGAEQLFGDDGIYFRTTDTFEISPTGIPSITVEKYNEESFSILDYMLSKSNNGTCIDKSKF